MTQPLHIFDLDDDALRQIVTDWGEQAYRAKQILEWVYAKRANTFDAMANLPKTLRDTLNEKVKITSSTIVRHQQATDGVEKLLMDWSGSLTPVIDPQSQTECVMIPTDKRRTACVSSQIGCAVGCRFCASGLGGLDGDLSAGQIVEQVWRLSHERRITNVVFMGMGEPLSNFENVTRAVRYLMADWGMNISGRRITISTVGLPAQIRRLADEKIPVTLAISLHAPNDDIRRELIPWADYVTINQLVEAGRYYFDSTGREITLEYILLRNVNDRPDHARELAGVARSLRSNVNLIRYNEVKNLPYGRPETDDIHRFQTILRDAGVNTHIRASRGRDIAAACGQLRHESSN